MSGRVVSVEYGEPYHLYIGRAWPRKGLPGSKWANPFVISIKKGLTRAGVLDAYEAYLRGTPELMAALPELRGKVLGCWCAPKGGLTADDPLVCHGQVLLRLLREMEVSR